MEPSARDTLFSGRTSDRIATLDELRAFAIGAVLFSHFALAYGAKSRIAYWLNLPDFAVGVDTTRKSSTRTAGRSAMSPSSNYRADHARKDEWAAEVKRRNLINMPDFDDVLYDFRTMVERVNARLKDEFGGRSVRVRGAVKVKCHLMFGILALTADQLIRLFSPVPKPA